LDLQMSTLASAHLHQPRSDTRTQAYTRLLQARRRREAPDDIF
jgi:hypothetical protein